MKNRMLELVIFVDIIVIFWYINNTFPALSKEFFVPGLCSTYETGILSVFLPCFSYTDKEEDETTDYTDLASEENKQAAGFIEENRLAADEKDENTQADDENNNKNAAAAKESGSGINLKKLEDFDYLLQNFYQVDNTTTIGSDQLNIEALTGVDLTVDTASEGPQILIYHTHSQEGYSDSVSGDASTSVVGVGDYLTKLLEKKGFNVLHHKGKYDVNDRDHAYSNAAPYIEKLLSDNPTIEVVIDLHRDGVSENTRLVTEQNGKKMAKIMFFNGLSRTTAAGDIAYLKNPYIAENLAFSFQMQLAAAEYYPDLTRKIYLKGYRFNMHFCPKSMLVEVGAQTNTFAEAKNAMEPLADLLAKVLSN